MSRRIQVNVLLACLLTATAVCADERTDRVVADWQARQSAVKRVRYHVTGTSVRHDKGGALPAGIKDLGVPGLGTKKAPPDLSAPRPASLVCLLDLETNRIRIEKESMGFGPNFSQIKRKTATCYNGNRLQTGVPRVENALGEGNAEMFISKGTLSSRPIDFDVWPILEAHGLVPTVNQPPRYDRLGAALNGSDLLYRNQATLNGRKCQLFHTEALNGVPALSDEFWVDAERGSAVVRHVYQSGRHPFTKLDVEFRSVEGHWLPQGWTLSSYQGPTLFETTKMTVTSVELNPPVTDGDFELPISPGFVLEVNEYSEAGKGVDPNRPASARYRVSDSGEWILVSQTGFVTPEGVVLPHPNETRNKWLWWVVSAVVVLTVGFGLIVRRFNRSRSRTVSP